MTGANTGDNPPGCRPGDQVGLGQVSLDQVGLWWGLDRPMVRLG